MSETPSDPRLKLRHPDAVAHFDVRAEDWRIPACPPILADLVLEAQQPVPDAATIVRMIEREPALHDTMLASARSALLGGEGGSETLASALEALGLRWGVSAVAAATLQHAIDALGGQETNSLWQSMVERALVIAYIARELNVADFHDAHAFGIFRDCGIAFMRARYLDYATWQEVVELAGIHDDVRLERKYYGMDHAKLGAFVARFWCLPHSIWMAVGMHHARDELIDRSASCDPLARKLVAIGALADVVVGTRRPLRTSSYWAREERFAAQLLGVSDGALDAVKADASLLLELS